jgi:hypothetical protein
MHRVDQRGGKLADAKGFNRYDLQLHGGMQLRKAQKSNLTGTPLWDAIEIEPWAVFTMGGSSKERYSTQGSIAISQFPDA